MTTNPRSLYTVLLTRNDEKKKITVRADTRDEAIAQAKTANPEWTIKALRIGGNSATDGPVK